PLNTAVARLRLGRVLLLEKRYREAEPELLAGYESLAKQTSASASSLKSARSDLVALYDALHQPEKATKFRTALAANESRLTNPSTAATKRDPIPRPSTP